MTPLVEARGLALAGRLEPTDLEVEGPALVCLVGPNGSGKTSLIHALARIGEAAGEVLVRGEALDAAPPARRKRLVSYLPASRDASWPLAVVDLVRLGLPTGARDEEAEAALAALSLEPFRERRVDRLSTGERSRVLIARALAPRPALLLLDEPAANLDPLWQLRLMDLLMAARNSGQAVIAAMHDLDMAGRHADRILLMDGGRIVADADPAAVLASNALREAFGVEKVDGLWRPFSPRADRRSSP